jgi:hypothetical protein
VVVVIWKSRDVRVRVKVLSEVFSMVSVCAAMGVHGIFLLSAGILSCRVVKWKLVTLCIIVFFFYVLGIVPRVDVVYIED